MDKVDKVFAGIKKIQEEERTDTCDTISDLPKEYVLYTTLGKKGCEWKTGCNERVYGTGKFCYYHSAISLGHMEPIEDSEIKHARSEGYIK